MAPTTGPLLWHTFAMLLTGLLFIANSTAAEFHISPLRGSDDNDGSAARPWESLQGLFERGAIESRNWDSLPYSEASTLVTRNQGAAVKGGDRILIESGNYGDLRIRGYYNLVPIVLAAKEGHRPLFSSISLQSVSNWVLQGLSINPLESGPTSAANLISLEAHGYHGPIESVTVTGCRAASTTDSSAWTREDWNTLAKNGIRVDGARMQIRNNTFNNVNFGITVSATHSLIQGNRVTNFAGDGMRGLGDYTTFEDNIIKNAYKVNANHDDGFQSWSRGADGRVGTGVVRGIILRGNTFINHEDPDQPFRATLQGIGCFDGMFEDWIVEDNIVKVDHWHGISLYGAVNSIIRSNIVAGLDNGSGIGPPWIRINTHKNGTPSTGSAIFCNITPRIVVSEGQEVAVEYNTLSNHGFPWHPACSNHAGRPIFGHPAIVPITPLLLK